MSKKEPWLGKWVIEEPLFKGGQGATYTVRNVKDSTRAVLKKLKNQKSVEARARIYQEVAHLRVLHHVGGKVPKVLDGNTDEFEKKNVRLYFVMEFIDGKRLSQIVQENHGLSLDQAYGIIVDLCHSIEIAHSKDIVHRDIKPENIIIHSLEPADVVIVDYGLSFNRDTGQDLTLNDERIDNEFLSLPERRVPGGNRRDFRSDLTGVCGILYYCITGHKPIDLIDSNGEPPHKRKGYSIREKLRDEPRVSQLEVFFDQGFSSSLDNRFQTIDELKSRLNNVISPAAKISADDPIKTAREATGLLLKHDRNTQLATFKVNSDPLIDSLQEQRQILSGNLSQFTITLDSTPPKFDDITEGDPVGNRAVFSVNVRTNQNRIQIAYQVRAKALQCCVYRCMIKIIPSSVWEKIGEWEPLKWYNGLSTPNEETIGAIVEDFNACVNKAIEIITHDLCKKGVGAC